MEEPGEWLHLAPIKYRSSGVSLRHYTEYRSKIIAFLFQPYHIGFRTLIPYYNPRRPFRPKRPLVCLGAYRPYVKERKKEVLGAVSTELSTQKIFPI